MSGVKMIFNAKDLPNFESRSTLNDLFVHEKTESARARIVREIILAIHTESDTVCIARQDAEYLVAAAEKLEELLYEQERERIQRKFDEFNFQQLQHSILSEHILKMTPMNRFEKSEDTE